MSDLPTSMLRSVRSSKHLTQALRLVLSLLAVAYVVYRLHKDQDSFGEILASLNGEMLIPLVGSFLLLGLNLSLETAKWLFLVRPFYPDLRFGEGLQAILAGMATGIFTPSRVGEYAGRILYLKPGRRLEAVLATFVNRLSQMLITLGVGLVAFLTFVTDQELNQLISTLIPRQFYLHLIIVVAGLIVLGILLFLLFPSWFIGLFKPLFGSRRWYRKLRFAAGQLPWRRTRFVILLALLRYMVFATQYALLMIAFGFEGPLIQAYVMVALIFLIKSLFPFFGLAELGIRELVAIEVMALYGVGATEAFHSALMLYLINIVLPVLCGLVFLQRIRLHRKEEEA